MAEIDAKVARVLDEYRLAINAGSERGVKMQDDVILWRLVEVKDPDSGEILGTVYLDALKLRVEDVHPKMSVARVVGDTSFLFNFGSPRKRIEYARGNMGSEAVRVAEGDAVSIIISGPDDAQPEAP